MEKRQLIPSSVIKAIFQTYLDGLDVKPSSEQESVLLKRTLARQFTVNETHQYIFNSINEMYLEDLFLSQDDYTKFDETFNIFTLAEGYTSWHVSLNGRTRIDEEVTGSEHTIELSLHHEVDREPFTLVSAIEGSPEEMIRRFVILFKNVNYDPIHFRDRFDEVKHVSHPVLPRHVVFSLFDTACREHAENHLTPAHRLDIVEDIMSKRPTNVEDAQDLINDYFFSVEK